MPLKMDESPFASTPFFLGREILGVTISSEVSSVTCFFISGLGISLYLFATFLCVYSHYIFSPTRSFALLALVLFLISSSDGTIGLEVRFLKNFFVVP